MTFLLNLVHAVTFTSTDGIELNPSGTYLSVVFQRPNGSVVFTPGKRLYLLEGSGIVVADIQSNLSHIVTLYKDPSGKYQVLSTVFLHDY